MFSYLEIQWASGPEKLSCYKDLLREMNRYELLHRIINAQDGQDQANVIFRTIEKYLGSSQAYDTLMATNAPVRKFILGGLKERERKKIIHYITTSQNECALEHSHDYVVTKGFMSRVPESSWTCASCTKSYEDGDALSLVYGS
ncbi:hypothetical protein PG988_006566 [Apiospora saccharicola]